MYIYMLSWCNTNSMSKESMEVQAKNPSYRHSGEEKDGWKMEGRKSQQALVLSGPLTS